MIRLGPAPLYISFSDIYRFYSTVNHILSQKYNKLDKNKEYHITSFEWVSILKIAEIIATRFPGTKVIPSQEKDIVQQDKRNEADTHILKYWSPKITIEKGIDMIIKEMQ